MREPLPTADQIAKLPPDGGPEFNRLIFEKSPYLLQHARNPVDWYPWGEEAFKRAKAEDKPIFLSVGYSTCHWCHVMERESFEKDDVAALLNEHFVAIKVDREERPDVDEIYMNATQLLTRHGGWPNSVWLTPDGRPWFAGTYFPPEDMYGRPGFKTLLRELAKAWQTRRQQVEQQADQLAAAVKRMSAGGIISGTATLSRDLVDDAVRQLRQGFDERLGGFGGAPKFPPHGALSLLLYEYRRTKDESLLQMATRTLEAMAMGGMHDQIGGGFHRYSTDERWFLPHFEKMLYDNAQLARVYVEAFVVTGNDDFLRVAEDVLEWVLREMTDEVGGFYSALDADSEGVEGKFYLWSEKEILELLGAEDGKLFCRVYGVEPDGNYAEEASGDRPGTNILYLPRGLEVSARVEGMTADELRARLQPMRQKLREVRDQRIWPHLDDKVLASWNGLMIGSLAYAGRQLDQPRYTAAAERAADFVLSAMRKDGRLLRTYRGGEAKLNAYLDDYAFLAEGLLELHEATGDQRWLDEARALADRMLEHFQDPQGGFYFTSDDHEALLIRSHDSFDKAIPSGNSVAARVLLELGKRTDEQRYLDAARKTLETSAGLMKGAPRAMESMLLATAVYFDRQPQPTATQPADEQPDAHLAEGPVTIDVFASRRRAAPGETLLIAVRLNVADGWHVNSSQPKQEYLVPTAVTIEPNDAVTIKKTIYPQAETVTLPFSPEPLSVYQDQVWVKLQLMVRDDASEGASPLKLTINVQPCDDQSCSPPQTHAVILPLEVSAAGGELFHAALFAELGMMESTSRTQPGTAG